VYFTALVADVVYGPAAALVVTIVTVLVYAGLWWVFPLLRRRQPDD
jgi:hypothetical protein